MQIVIRKRNDFKPPGRHKMLKKKVTGLDGKKKTIRVRKNVPGKCKTPKLMCIPCYEKERGKNLHSQK